MATKISATEARSILGELLARVGYGRERFVLERRGKPLAALVNIDDLRRLESFESQERGRSPRLLGEAAEEYVAAQAVESDTQFETQHTTDTLPPAHTMLDIDNIFASLAGIWQHLSDDDIRQMEQDLLEMRQQTAERLAALTQGASDE